MDAVGVRAVLAKVWRRERVRQMDIEYRHPAGDDATGWPALLLGARAYLDLNPELWPWAPEGFKPKSRYLDLVRAGALAMAAGEVAVRALDFPALVHVETVTRDAAVKMADLYQMKPRQFPAWVREEWQAVAP